MRRLMYLFSVFLLGSGIAYAGSSQGLVKVSYRAMFGMADLPYISCKITRSSLSVKRVIPNSFYSKSIEIKNPLLKTQTRTHIGFSFHTWNTIDQLAKAVTRSLPYKGKRIKNINVLAYGVLDPETLKTKWFQVIRKNIPVVKKPTDVEKTLMAFLDLHCPN